MLYLLFDKFDSLKFFANDDSRRRCLSVGIYSFNNDKNDLNLTLVTKFQSKMAGMTLIYFYRNRSVECPHSKALKLKGKEQYH